jgi:hypothetical protein
MMHDVIATDGPDRKHQARQEPQAEHHRGTGLRQPAEGEPAAEDQREDTADHPRPDEHPTEPSMEGVVTAAEPIGELERCPEEVQHTRREVQVGQPRLLHVAMVKLVLRQGAGGQIGHVDHEALDDREDDDHKEQHHCYLHGAKPLSTERDAAAHGQTIRVCCLFAEGFGDLD